MPPPTGGRAHADYAEEHTAAIGRYVRLKELGFPPAAIRVLLQAREGVPFPVADGITLVVAPDLHASGMEAEPLVLAEKEGADAHAAMAHRRYLHGLRTHQVRGETERPDVGGQIPQPDRARQVPEMLEEVHPVGPSLELMRRTAALNLERRSRSACISASISLGLFVFRTAICVEGAAPEFAPGAGR